MGWDGKEGKSRNRRKICFVGFRGMDAPVNMDFLWDIFLGTVTRDNFFSLFTLCRKFPPLPPPPYPPIYNRKRSTR